MTDFNLNNAGPQLSLEQIEARLELKLEAFIDQWLVGLSQLYECDEFYDPRDFKKSFLKMCSEEFDRPTAMGASMSTPSPIGRC